MCINQKRYYCAVDLSGPCSSFAVLDKNTNRILIAKSLTQSNRNKFSFFDELFNTLQELNVDINSIVKWLVGIGPGSFTGLRIASSFISGITYGNSNVEVKVIPSAFPLASKIHALEGEKVAVLYYASRNEILVYGVCVNCGCLKKFDSPFFIGKKDLHMLDSFEHIVYMQNKFIVDILSDFRLENMVPLDSYPIDLMFQDYSDISGYSLDDLIYIRPAAGL